MVTRKSMVGVVAAIFVSCCFTATYAQEIVHGRVSFDSGAGLVKGGQDADWSYATTNTLVLAGDTLWADEGGQLELEMPGDAFLRMADGTKAEIVALPPRGLIRGWTGAFYLQRTARSAGDFAFETPACSIMVDADTNVRVDILANGSTTVSVRWGSVAIRTVGGQVDRAVTGQRVYVDPGFYPSEPLPFDRNAEDVFDAWNRERAKQLAVGIESIPAEIRTASTPIGAADLASYGEWVYVDNTRYWRPTVVADYVPYRRGHWSFVSGSGYVWVGDYPFGYVTSHYGRWRHHDIYGWIWTYRPVWSPAWCATVQYGSNFVWAPLDPWDRPVAYGSEYFIVGGVRFGYGAASFCPVDDVLIGACYTRPFGPSYAYGIPTTQIIIWNIYIGDDDYRHGRGREGHRDRDRDGRGRRGHHYWGYDDDVTVRDYSPRRSIRGWDDDKRGRARARAEHLESREGRRSEFRVVKDEEHRRERTRSTDDRRSQRLRSVAVDPEASRVERVRQRVSETSRFRDSDSGERRRDRGDARDREAPPQIDVRPERSSAGESGRGDAGRPDGPPRGRDGAPSETERRGGRGSDDWIEIQPGREMERTPRSGRSGDDSELRKPRAPMRTPVPSSRREVLRNPDDDTDIRPVPRITNRGRSGSSVEITPGSEASPEPPRSPRRTQRTPDVPEYQPAQQPTPEPAPARRVERPEAPRRSEGNEPPRSRTRRVEPETAPPPPQPAPDPPRRVERPEPPRRMERPEVPRSRTQRVQPEASPPPLPAPEPPRRIERPEPSESRRSFQRSSSDDDGSSAMRRGRGSDDGAETSMRRGRGADDDGGSSSSRTERRGRGRDDK